MSLIVRMRKQQAVFWQRLDIPNKFGVFGYAAPVEISCRWEGGVLDASLHFNAEAKEVSTVYVDRDMKAGDMLKLGAIDSSTLDDPTLDDNAHTVQRFDKLPNLHNTESLRTAFLFRTRRQG